MLKYRPSFCPLDYSPRWSRIVDSTVLEHEAVAAVQFSHYQPVEGQGKSCAFCHTRGGSIVPQKNRPASMAKMGTGLSCHADDTAYPVDGT